MSATDAPTSTAGPLRTLLHRVPDEIADYRGSLRSARVYPGSSIDDLRRALGGPLDNGSRTPAEVTDALVAGASRLVRVAPAATADRVLEAVQRDGTCWLGDTTWRGQLLRVSVSNHTTTEPDVDRTVETILRAWHTCTQ